MFYTFSTNPLAESNGYHVVRNVATGKYQTRREDNGALGTPRHTEQEAIIDLHSFCQRDFMHS